MSIKTTYSNIYKNVKFGLYEMEDIDFKETKQNILEAFKEEYEEEIKKRLSRIGLKLESLEYYSPRAYNFENDNLDTIISITNKKKVIEAIKQNKKRIQKRLDANKSYDGYHATTVNTIAEGIEKVNEEGRLDIILLSELLDFDCSEFDIYNYVVYELDEETKRA